MVERIRERFVERTDLASFHEAVKARIDREAGVIKDVKLMGLESRNGRRYRVPDPTLFENVAIRLNHHGKENGPEMPVDPPFEGIWATAKNIKVSEAGVRGDIHYNKAHPMVPTILWWAENQSTIGGFSPITWGLHSDQGGERVIDILSVESVDLVDRPATTRGLFEQEMHMDPKEILRLQEAERNLGEKVSAAEKALTDEKAKTAAAEKRAAEAEGKLAAQEAASKAAERKTARLKLITDAKLPEGVATEKFNEAVINASSDADATALIETLVKAAGAPRSESTTPDPTGGKGAKPKFESFDAAKAAGAFDYRETV